MIISPESEFDWKSISVEEPKLGFYGNYSSKVYVKGRKGEERPIYIKITQTKNSVEISGVWPFSPSKSKSKEKLD